MKAAVCYEFGQPLTVEELEIDPPQAGEVKVKMAAAAICHSDIHSLKGEWYGQTPVVAGHEAAGVVEDVGKGVTLVKPGDPVVVSLIRSCGVCFYCATGGPHLCEGGFALNTESRLRNQKGETVHHGLDTAAFAEYAIVDQSQLVPLPDDVPLESAALLACGVITGYGAVVNTAQVPPGSSVVVIGVGGVGLNAIQGAAISGAYPIVALDLLDGKLAAAEAFGATHGVNAGDPGAAKTMLKALTEGRGADYVFVTVGSSAAVEQALGLIRSQGTVVLVGIPHRQATASINVYDHVVHEFRVIGSLMGGTRLRVDVPRLLALYRAGRLKLDELITARYPLDGINEALAATESGEALRNVILF